MQVFATPHMGEECLFDSPVSYDWTSNEAIGVCVAQVYTVCRAYRTDVTHPDFHIRVRFGHDH